MRVRKIGGFWVKLAAFLCLLVMMCNAAGRLLNGDLDGTRNAITLRYLPRNSVDVLWLGSSHMYCGVIPQMLYDEYGITSAILGVPNISVGQMYWGLKETLRYQSPDVVVIDLYTATVPYSYGDPYDEAYYCRTEKVYPGTNSYNQAGQMPRWIPLGSPYKPLVMREASQQYGIIATDMFELTQMHEQYSNIGQASFLAMRGQNAHMLDFGFDFRYRTMNPDEIIRKDYTYESSLQGKNLFWRFTEEQLAEVELLPIIDEGIQRVIQLVRGRGIELVFCVVPYMVNAAENKIYQQLASIAQEEGIAFVGAEAFRIEDDQLYDMGHLNMDGALRYTAFWGEELSRRFDLPDRRRSADSRYAAWREHTGRYLSQIAAGSEYDTMSEYLEMLTTLDEDFLILLGFQGPVYERFSEDDYRLLVEELGIPEGVLSQWYDTGEGVLNVLVHNKQALASNYDTSAKGVELRWNAFGNAVSINGGRHKVNQKSIMNSDKAGLHITVFSLSSSKDVKQLSFDLTQVGE